MRTFLVFSLCLYGMAIFMGGFGLWAAWPVAEIISLIITVVFLGKYKTRYQY